MKNGFKKLADRGEAIYQRLKPKLLAVAKNKFAAIDTTTEDFFIGKTLLEALQRARHKYPHHKFHFVRIGHPACVSFKHKTRP